MKMRTLNLIFFVVTVCHMTIAQIPLAKFYANPLLSTGSGDYWDSRALQVDAVLYDGETYHMWYTGVNDFDSPGAIGYATSVDSISWEKYAHNPVFQKGQPGRDHC